MTKFPRAGIPRLTKWAVVVALALAAPDALAQTGAGGVGAVTRVLVATKDSTGRVERIFLRLDSLKKRYETLPVGSAESNEVETAIQAALRELPRSGVGGGATTFEVHVRGPGMALRTPMDVVPQGWLGFTALGLNETWFESGSTFLQYLEYPAIVTVEANSPASRAGVRAGDSLVAYNGRDVIASAVNMTTLLIPGRDISVRVRRSGEMRDVLMTVEKASEQVIFERRRQVNETIAANQVLDRRTTEEQAIVRAAAGPKRVPTQGPTTVATGPTIARTGRPMPAAVFMPATAGILGAGMTAVTPNMAASLVGMKGKSGVLVTTLPDGSVAARTGLLEYDVILRVESKAVSSIAELRAALVEAERAGQEKIKLSIMRAGKTTDLTYIPR